jgi:serine protease
VHLFDIEEAWRLDHADLAPLGVTLLCNTNRDGRNGFQGDHGNATLGVVAGVANDVGVVGIAHRSASVRVASHFKVDGLRIEDPLAVVDALTAVGTVVGPGDVVLIEAQRAGLPVETQVADFDAIRFAAGVAGPTPRIGAVVVEPAGNGDDTDGVDLDVPQGTPVAGTQWWATRTDDSGAVLVGAGRSQADAAGGHACRRESNFGSAVHCHAWGDRVLTAGAQDYLPGYGGTSAAAAIVSGVAAVVQGMHRAAHGTPLAAVALRALLADPALGTPQHMPPAHAIGPMPDLSKLAVAVGAIPVVP